MHLLFLQIMNRFSSLFSLFVLVIFCTHKAVAQGHVKFLIGAIVDNTTRVGIEEIIAMEMAVKDFYDYSNQSVALCLGNSLGEPLQAALEAMYLIKTQQVEAIVGLRTWEEASLVADIGSRYHIPVLSFADATPKRATERWPYLIQEVPNQYAQMNAIEAIVQSFDWRQLTVIYEDMDSSISGLMPQLSDAFYRVISVHLLPLPTSSSSSFSNELEQLRSGQCRVFVVHLSFPLAARFFERAKEMGMMEMEYVWIATDTFRNLVHSINASSISSMQGIIGVKSYVPENKTTFRDFYSRFHKKFSSEYPEEYNHEPGVFAVQAYEAIWRVALAMRESSRMDQNLLDKILTSNYNGLSGRDQVAGRESAPAHVFQIINVIGKSYKELGFWSDGLGFSRSVDGRSTYNSSMISLGQVFWPGGPITTPRGWTLPTKANPLKIGVPSGYDFSEFVHVVYHTSQNNFSFEGFSIEVFKAVVKKLQYSLPYKFIRFPGTYDELVEQVYLMKFDAVVGDMTILAKRCAYAEFTQPYTDSGLTMIVPVRSHVSKSMLFLKPFTKSLWILIWVINVYNGFVVWLIERNHCPELKGSPLTQIGILIWLSFATLLSLQGNKLHSNLSRMSMVVWLFVALIITQTYTANLTSILTVPQLEPTVTNFESLRNSNAIVGSSRGSYVAEYLTNVLGFHTKNIKIYNSLENYAIAFKSQEIKAAFLEGPLAKLFLAKNCKGFTAAGPTFKVGGYGFVFPKGSPLLADVTEAMLKISESGELRDLEKKMLQSKNCADEDSNDDMSSLTPNSFRVLFMLSGGTSSVVLIIYVIHKKWIEEESSFGHNIIWRLMAMVVKIWEHHQVQFSRTVSPI